MVFKWSLTAEPCWNLAGTFGSSNAFRNLSATLPEHYRNLSGTSPEPSGTFPEPSGTFSEPFRNLSGTSPEPLRNLPGTFPEPSGTSSEPLRNPWNQFKCFLEPSGTFPEPSGTFRYGIPGARHQVIYCIRTPLGKAYWGKKTATEKNNNIYIYTYISTQKEACCIG